MWEDLENYLLGGASNQHNEVKQSIVMNDVACGNSGQQLNDSRDNFAPIGGLDAIATLPTSTPSSYSTQTLTHLSSSAPNFDCQLRFESDNIATANEIQGTNTYNASDSNSYVQPKLENLQSTANSSYNFNDASEHYINIANLSIASQQTSPVPTPSPCYSNCQYSSTPLPSSPPNHAQPSEFQAVNDNSHFTSINNLIECRKEDSIRISQENDGFKSVSDSNPHQGGSDFETIAVKKEITSVDALLDSLISLSQYKGVSKQRHGSLPCEATRKKSVELERLHHLPKLESLDSHNIVNQMPVQPSTSILTSMLTNPLSVAQRSPLAVPSSSNSALLPSISGIKREDPKPDSFLRQALLAPSDDYFIRAKSNPSSTPITCDTPMSQASLDSKAFDSSNDNISSSNQKDQLLISQQVSLKSSSLQETQMGQSIFPGSLNRNGSQA